MPSFRGLLPPGDADRVLLTRLTMYITDAGHFLDKKGSTGPRRDPAKAIAEFLAGVFAYATDFDDTGLVAATCFRKGPMEPVVAPDEAIYWSCPRCKAEGRISHRLGALWGFSVRDEPRG